MSSTPVSVSAESFYESKDHFFRFRRHLTAYVHALSADPRLHTGTALTLKAIHQGLQEHLHRFPSDIFHKGTRELAATLTYFWRIENSDAGDPPFEPVEEPESVVRLLFPGFTVPSSLFLARRSRLFLERCRLSTPVGITFSFHG